MIIKDVSAAELEVMEIIWAAGKPVIITDIWQAIEGHDYAPGLPAGHQLLNPRH